jgi:glucokinase
MAVTIGVDIGGTKVAAGVVSEHGEVLVEGRTPTPKAGADAVIDVIVDLVSQMRAQTDDEILGVGVGVAGPVDADRSRVLLTPNLNWVDEPLKAKLEDRLELPVVVENDANAAAWAEYRFGAGAGRGDMVMVTVGTGVGGGLVLNDNLQRGAHGLAAEFGHITLVPGGRICGCGRRGCWEQYASGNALVRIAREFAAEMRSEATLLLELGDGTPEGVQGLHVTEAANLGDPVALQAFAELGKALGEGMADVAALLDPGIFVIGGGVVEAGYLVLDPTKASFEEALFASDLRPPTPIVLATMGNAAGIAGAGDLARPEHRDS